MSKGAPMIASSKQHQSLAIILFFQPCHPALSPVAIDVLTGGDYVSSFTDVLRPNFWRRSMTT